MIFTDLDGTLLDEETYSYAEAQPALGLLASSATPLILCSSKTRAEIEIYRRRMDNAHPFIAENGGGIYIPQGYFSVPIVSKKLDGYQLILLGTSYVEIKDHFDRLRKKSGAKVRGFSDMTIDEISVLTGLSVNEAVLAKQRDFDEPFVFEVEPDEDFLRAIEDAGLYWTQGRIFHIMGHHDKGRAVNILMSLYRQQYGDVVSIGLGDNLNDLPMLMEVDHPVLVRHKDGGYDSRIALPRLLKTQLPGPLGWNEIVLQLLAQEPGGKFSALLNRQNLLDIFNASLEAVDPYKAVLNAVSVEHGQLQAGGANYVLAAYERIIVIGAGKATARMAQAIEVLFGKNISDGLIVVKEGHTAPLSIIKQVEAAHPVPNEAGMAGAQRILKMVCAADEKSLVICLLSGGASALLVAPAAGLSLHDKQDTTELLLKGGASINELNAVRKHLSSVKGGRMAQAAYPAPVLTLIVSDVIGDPLEVIASGPTAYDNSTYAEAWAVIAKYDLQQKISLRVADYLQRGITGHEPETVKENDPCLDKTRNVIIASNRQALTAAERMAVQIGYDAKIISATLQGEARNAASFLAQISRAELVSMQPSGRRCLLFGGETTVTVSGAGHGGRNQELALAFALEIEGARGVSLLSAGTDGGDGPTDAAGAVVDGSTVTRARKLGLEPLHYLEQNDSYTFFQQFDSMADAHTHLKTGPTGTNVMDMQIVLLHADEPLVG